MQISMASSSTAALSFELFTAVKSGLCHQEPSEQNTNKQPLPKGQRGSPCPHLWRSGVTHRAEVLMPGFDVYFMIQENELT
jgi:hypothetical protein